MKKFYYLLASMAFVLVVIMACEKSAIGVDEIQTVKDDVLLSKGEAPVKVTICHYDADLDESYQITISENGLNGHQGDETTPRHEGDDFDPIANDLDGDGIGDCADCSDDGLAGSMKKMWYYDYDGDGYGTEEYIKTCDPRPEMYYTAEVGGDCNDDDANLFPYSPGGTYVFLQTHLGVDYYFDITITSDEYGVLTGVGGYPAVGYTNETTRPVISGHEPYVNLITFTFTENSEGNYTMVMVYTEGEGIPYTRTFANVSTSVCYGISSLGTADDGGTWSIIAPI